MMAHGDAVHGAPPPSVVTHGVAEHAGRRRRETRHQLGQRGELGFAGQQQVEDRIAQQRERERQPTPARPARRGGPPERRQPGTNARSAGANERRRRARAARSASRTSSSRPPSPRSRRWRAPSPALRVLRSHGSRGRLRRAPAAVRAKRQPSAAASAARLGSMSINSTSAPGSRAASAATRAADNAGADDRDPVSRTRHAVPQPVDRRFHVGGERRAPVRDIVGNGDDGILRNDEPVLMGMQAEDAACRRRSARAVLDDPGHRVAVFDRGRELALLERTAHALPFALRHFAAKDEGFGASADRRSRGPGSTARPVPATAIAAL